MTETYFTGKPCKNGHIALRNVQSKRCVECIKKYYATQCTEKRKLEISIKKKEWRARNNDRFKKLQKITRNKNKHRISQQIKIRRNNNPDKFREQRLKSYRKHKVSFLLRQKIYQRNNSLKIKERILKYYKEHKAEYLARCRKRQTLQLQRTPIWADMKKIEQIYIHRQEISGVTGIIYHVDHIIPLQGKNVCGLHVENNLQIIPAKDNLSKHAKYEV